MLRDYQTELVDDVAQAWRDGFNAPCIVLPCGGGKSVIVAEIAKRTTQNGKRVLFIVHRKELCEQIENTFKWWGVDMSLCEVAMVQTLCRHLSKTQKPALIITDENHHSKASSYRKIYDYFPDVKRVGVTATPVRIDGSGLKDVNDKLIIGVSAKWLIKNNYLAPYDYYAPVIDLPKLHTRNGDYIQSEVSEHFKKQKIHGDVIKHYRKFADGKQAICYCPTIEFSELTAAEFNRAGITAAHIDGTTPKSERSDIVERFRNGEIKILCNVDLISEGFDVPDCECAILLRPTKSLTLYIQQSMRCMRYKPDKRAIIIDHVGNVIKHALPDTDREWTLEDKPKLKKGEQQNAPAVIICKDCFKTLPPNTAICPHCGYKFRDRNPEQVKEAALIKITDEVKTYLTPNECNTFKELQIYAKLHGYKPGWAYYQAKARGLLYGNKNGNKTAKRYPIRAVEGWNSTQK